jgi:high-affinity iron transporter
VLETIAWLAYLVPVLVLFLMPARATLFPARKKPAAAPAPEPNVVSETPQHVEARA